MCPSRALNRRAAWWTRTLGGFAMWQKWAELLVMAGIASKSSKLFVRLASPPWVTRQTNTGLILKSARVCFSPPKMEVLPLIWTESLAGRQEAGKRRILAVLGLVTPGFGCDGASEWDKLGQNPGKYRRENDHKTREKWFRALGAFLLKVDFKHRWICGWLVISFYSASPVAWVRQQHVSGGGY